jgi:hypothetical protein
MGGSGKTAAVAVEVVDWLLENDCLAETMVVGWRTGE